VAKHFYYYFVLFTEISGPKLFITHVSPIKNSVLCHIHFSSVVVVLHMDIIHKSMLFIILLSVCKLAHQDSLSCAKLKRILALS